MRIWSALWRVRWLFRRFSLAILLVLFSLAIGTLGLNLLTGASFFEAFYFTVITLSTVGYGETIPLDERARMFMAGLILFNLGAFAYAFTIVTGFLVDGEGRKAWKLFRMQQKIDQLHDHVIICGFGRLGHQVAKELQTEGHGFVVIEQEPRPEDDKVLLIRGDALSDKLLRDAGIDRAQALVAALPKDTDNVFLILTARELNPHVNIISRVSNPNVEPRMRHAGATHVILPEKIGGKHMAQLITRPDLVKFMDLLLAGSRDAVFYEVPIQDLPPDWRGKTLEELRDTCGTSVNIVGLRHQKELIVNPDRDHHPAPDDSLIVLGRGNQIDAFRKAIGSNAPPVA